MRNVKHAIKLGFVIAMVVFAIVFSGCVNNQEVIHSTVSYQTTATGTSLELIPENITPLSAPRVIADSNTELIILNCEYVQE